MTLQTATQSLRPVLDRTKLTGLKELIGEAKCNAAIQRFKGELFACLAAIERNAPECAVHAHNLAGVAALLGFEDLEDKSRRFLVALHENKEEVRPSAESLLVAAQKVERELDTILIQLYGEAGSHLPKPNPQLLHQAKDHALPLAPISGSPESSAG